MIAGFGRARGGEGGDGKTDGSAQHGNTTHDQLLKMKDVMRLPTMTGGGGAGRIWECAPDKM
ncbi:hypothetical protein GCM10007858_44590 [Bradyrhizobium liaoningense]|nr:hypothetical protein GCM10007858_44590 [Bradyrhizobium liaoningense]